MAEKYYMLEMDDYFLPAFCSGGCYFFDSFENIEKFINMLKNERRPTYPYTIKAFDEYKAGNIDAIHYIAYNEVKLLTETELIDSREYSEINLEPTVLNTWGFDYNYKIEKVQAMRNIFKMNDKYYAAIKAALYNPREEGLFKDYRPVDDDPWGLPCFFTISKENDILVFRTNLFKCEKAFDTEEEARDYLNTPLDLKVILQEFFGDG